ncbi:M20/M25/M40 family metallo-hydrolase [Candidatus Formimonas warabiya]|uniref:M20/M25/M40 family metallo-hydrolase n=1 Tax=Formimonas warabiya TaxID=1761012 RepID=A0A3G1KWF4_FORW1|nr:M20/M25/M40 family metallo-hydrolase [Candidatus Formimonas warabiya]ATW26782.1 hypothetical protein DCMF_20230 [Candidatus Formimonas warabiya]
MVDDNMSMYDYIKKVTFDLVKVPSRVRQAGEEKDFAFKLRDMIGEIPYFAKHPENVMLVPLEGDQLGRYSVLALLEGEEESPETVILLSHFDTVGTGDYGELEPYALDPGLLKEKMKAMRDKYSQDVQDDLDADAWIFGRGTGDMKAGVAINLCVLREFSQDAARMKGNILFICAADEEAMAKGAQAAAKKVYRMVRDQKSDFLGLIKTDIMLRRYPDDDHNYLYLGTIGKYLLSFYICGVPSHVGECFAGVDSNLIASKLVDRISMNCDFSDEAEEEITPPPVTLKQTDLKEVYDVQLPYESQVYFNYFTYTKTPSQVLAVGKREACRVMEALKEQYLAEKEYFHRKAGIPHTPRPLEANIYTYDEFYEKVVTEKPHLRRELAVFAEGYQYHEADETKLSLAIVRKLFKESKEFHEQKPCIIVYLAPPYVPRVYVKGETEKEKHFIDSLERAVTEDNNHIKIRKFYPYLSDMSWFGMSDEISDIEILKANTPGFHRTCTVELEPLTELKIPGVNIGPYCKDPHQATERLYMPYSFDYVPRLICRTVKNLLNK